MSYNRELEEILASIKKDKEKLNKLLDNSSADSENGVFRALSRTERDAKPVIVESIKIELGNEIALPKPSETKNDEFTLNESETESESDTKVQSITEIFEEPSVQSKQTAEPAAEISKSIAPPEPPVGKEAEKREKIKEKKPNKKAKQKKKALHKKQFKHKKEGAAKPKISFKERLSLLLQLARKKLITKQIGILLAVIVLIIAAVATGVKIYDYSKTAYLKPYQEKYNITYPEGILEQFCDQYGKRQSTVGAVAIEDNGTNIYVTNERTRGFAFAPKGTDVFAQQQFRAIETNNTFDIESLYATGDSFVNSSQKVTFNTLFEKKEYRVIAAYYTNKIPEDDNGYVFPYNIYGNLTEKSFEHFADSMKHRCLYDTGFEMTYDQNYISIYSDSDFMADFVFVILCAETDKNFDKITAVKAKEKIHYPQILYDAKGINNPYFLAGRWYPEIITNPETQKSKKLTAEDYDFE